MKKSIKEYAFQTLLPLLAFVLLTGGCGGSGGGGSGGDGTGGYAPAVGTIGELEFDSDNDGIPDVFECAGLQEIDGTNGGTFSASVPFLFYSAGSADSAIDMEFEAGVEYTFEFSHALGQSLEAALPNLTLCAPDGREAAFDFGLSDSDREEGEEAPAIPDNMDNVAAVQTLTVGAELTILPEEDPSLILFTFKAPFSGNWRLAASQQDLDATGEKIPWMLRVYEEMRGGDGSCGYPLQLTLGDTEFVVGQRELIDLRRVILSYATEFNKMGFPTAMSDEFYEDEVFQDLIDAIIMEYEHAGGIASAAGGGASLAASGAAIATRVDNVPYDVIFSDGAGFYAHSGLLAPTQNALEPFTAPSPKNSGQIGLKTDFYDYNVNTLEELIRDLNLGAMSTFALGMNALGQRPITSTNVRLGQLSRTLLFRFETVETSPRLVDISSLKFSKTAKEALDEGSDAFREDYGDYFVSGYTWGARYDIVISVTSEKDYYLNMFCDELKEAMNNAWNNSNYFPALRYVQNLISENKVSMMGELIVIGAGKSDSPKVTNENLKSLLAGLKEFRNNVNTIDRNQFARLRVSLTRFREVPGGNAVNERLPISQSHFDAVKEFTKSILLLRCYYNTMAGVPLSTLINGQGKVDEWDRRFNERINSIKAAVRKICDSESLLAQQKREVDRLMKEFKDLTERYVFYRKLVDAQESQSGGFANSDDKEDSVAAGGIEKYTASKTVLGDYYKGGEKTWGSWSFNKGAPFLDYHTWSFNNEGSDYNNWRNVWVRASSHNTNKSKAEDHRYPTVGKKGYKWYFEGGGTRRAEWYFKVQIAYMPESRYPFVGLR